MDSATTQDNDFTPFLNIMNEWYAKDTSNKIKAIFKSRMKDGMRCSGSIPYGYKRKPDDKQTLIVDEPAAEVYAFGCPNREATVERLRLVAALAPDPAAKKLFYILSVKLSDEGCDKWYRCFLKRMRVEVEADLRH